MTRGALSLIERARQATRLLQGGTLILNVVDLAGYADQPHLTRSLRRFIGLTPRRPLLWTANLTWMSLVLMFAALFIGLSQNGGQFGPGVLIGWPKRLVVVAYCAWLMTAAWFAESLRPVGG